MQSCRDSGKIIGNNFLRLDNDFLIFRISFVGVVKRINTKYEKELISIEIKDQYYNMKEKVVPVMHIVDLAEEAMKQLGIEPLIKPIRGGTDGSQLSYMGLPCPNIFAGGHNFHGRYEYVPVESMQKAVSVICKIAELTQERYR